MEEIKQINVDGVNYDIVSKELSNVTYAKLKALRDGSQLKEGHLYRITDYVTTTRLGSTKSANHPFDIIVTALNKNTLDEKASAIAHEDDTYFDGNDLSAWELWYDLDSDTDKYEWADATNGKGVIYRMIDEKRNDCPYDFKNILFFNDRYTNYTTTDKYYFTFSYVENGILYDGTVEKQITICHDNSMATYITQNMRLPRNVFRNASFSNSCHNNTFGNNCHNNTFDYGNYCNTFGDNCTSNFFGKNCQSNTFGNNCHNNTFDYSCNFNTFEHHCQYNTFASNCSGNTFGSNTNRITFGRDCQNRHVNKHYTSITLNDEYYDDGSGQLVPIKHPDLSTQPSILPYKFMGRYVYEQLIPIKEDKIYDIEINLLVDEPIFISAGLIEINGYIPAQIYNTGGNLYSFNTYSPSGGVLYGHIVYTSMPEEDSYYGYNEY